MKQRRSGGVLTVVLFTGIVALGITFRVAASRGLPLWQDEAETIINSMQVVDHGYPSDTFNGKPLFESRSYLESDDPKYAFIPTNYAGTHFERNKGWLTYYYESIFLSVFGFSTPASRLPFVALFAVSCAVLFAAARKWFGTPIALLASLFYSVNYYSIVNERQARYFTLETALVLLCLFWTYRAIESGKARTYCISALGIVLLFYTHVPAAATMLVWFFVAHLMHRRNLSFLRERPVWLTLLGVLVATAPWVIMVRLWQTFGTITDHTGFIVWPLLMLAFGIGYYFLQLAVPFTRPNVLFRFSPVTYLIGACGTVMLLKPLLTPAESIGGRLFVELNPVFGLLFAVLIYNIFSKRHAVVRIAQYTAILVFGAGIFFILNDAIGIFRDNLYDSRWVTNTIAFLDERHVTHDTPIFVPYQQFPFMLYSGYNVDLVWPIRKSYIDMYPGTMYIILTTQDTNLYMFYKPPLPAESELPYAGRLPSCNKSTIDARTTAYECPPLGS